MGRPRGRKPFFRLGRGWYVVHEGKQIRLTQDDDREAAWEQWHRVLARPAAVESELVVGIVDGYLEWCKQNRASRTYDWSRMHLESFCRSLPNPHEFQVSALRQHHVLAWADSHPGWGSNFKRGAIGAVQRAFNWAEKVGHIERSPIRTVEGKPPAERREQYLTPLQFEGVIANYAPGDPFRDLLSFVWWTGCRPQEVKVIEARHYIPERERLELPPKEAKGKRRWRIIHLTEDAKSIVERLAEKHPQGSLFRNEDGKPWTAYATNCRLQRLKKKLGYKISLYTLRHSWCQRMLEAGLDMTVVASLMGHSNASMVASVYQHMDKSQHFLREQLRKVEG